jgi:uncharacterized SAM-binding protein YcdF (DUF218 family)
MRILRYFNSGVFGWKRSLRLVLIFLVAAIAISEISLWIGSSIANNPPATGRCIVLVLGYPAHADGTADPVQESRVEEGIRAYQKQRCEKIIFSGGAVKNQIVEANSMANLAIRAGVRSERIVTETKARSTWENIKFSLPLIQDYDKILVASNSLHAHRGRRYLCKQRQNLCDRTFISATYQPLRLWWWQTLASFYELFKLVVH